RSRTPAESTIPRLFVGLVDAAPASRTAKASACQLFRGYRAASAPAAYASRMVLPPPMQSSLPAGQLAFTGRESNPLDRDERFQITFSSPSPGLFLAQRRLQAFRYLHGCSGCFRLERCRVGLAPTGKRRLVTAHTRPGL